MKEKIEKMKEWWSNLAQRERKAILILVPVVVIFGIYQFIWQPFVNVNYTLRKRIQSEQMNLLWMQAADVLIQKTEKQVNSNDKQLSPVMLMDLLQKQINHNGLESSLLQLKQASNDSVEMHFQKVEFDKLIQLLINVIKEEAVSIKQLTATADTTSGVVNADITLFAE